ncbi:MAG: restriction endonuclease [Candidatus Pacebacteria bacterium]|nr:restriction endonuclease [Candidatus Paceibacterota bacterium]
MDILVKKYDGSMEKFNRDKLAQSIKKNGGPAEIVDEVCNYLKKENITKITTEKVYKITRDFLKKRDKSAYLKYNLPLAISRLGPEGFAFEKFVGEVFEAYDYKPVYVGKKIQGKCVIHEMDIVAYKNNKILTAELKFHNSRSKKSDLKVVLYMKARFDDIVDGGFYENKTPRQVIITNTKFTYNARNFAKCAGVEVLAWNYPESNNLYNFILKSGVHPITAISAIPQKAIGDFIKRKIVSCRGVLKNNHKELKNNFLIPKEKIPEILKEIKAVCDFSEQEKNNFNLQQY